MKKLLLSLSLAIGLGFGASADTYKLVTDASTLSAGDKIIIATGSYALGTTQQTNYRKAESVKILNNEIVDPANTIQIITLEESGNTTFPWLLNVGDGYLNSPSASNYLKTTTTPGTTGAYFKITISSSNTQILSNRSTYEIQKNSTNAYFSCYKGTQTAVSIYRLENESGEPVEMSWSFSTVSVNLGEELTNMPALNVTPEAAKSEVKYESSNEDVATIDITTGTVTINGAGKTTIKAYISDSDTYKNVYATYELTVVDPNATESQFIFSEMNFENQQVISAVTVGIVTLVFDQNSNSNPPKYFDNGKDVRLYGGGQLAISVPDGYILKSVISTFNNTANTLTCDNGEFNTDYTEWTATTATTSVIFKESGTSGNRSWTKIVVNYEKANGKEAAGLEYETESYNVTLGDAFTAPTLVNPNNLEVTYSSSDAAVAEVDAATGAVTIKGAGTATITATSAETETYNEGKASYTINVTLPLPKFVLTNKIVSGKKYVLVADGKVSTAQAGSNGGYASGQSGYLQTVDVTVANDIVEVSEEYAITFTETEGGYLMQNYLDNYICMNGTYNGLNVYATANDASVWTVEPQEDGTMKITNVEKGKYLQYVPNYKTYGSYTSDQTNASLPTLYVLGGDEPEVPAAPALMIDGSEYTESSYSTSNDSGSIEVEINVPEGHEVYYKLEETAANVAAYAAEEGYTLYTDPITVSGNQTLNYYAVNTATGVQSATREIAFHITTGIEGVEVDAVNGVVEYFNLQGVKVEAPANGLYIRRQGTKVEKVIVK